MTIFKPILDKVLVKRFENELVSKAGLHLLPPDEAIQRRAEGQVIEVGPGSPLKDGTLRPLGIKKGDIVSWIYSAGWDVKIDGVSYLVMKEGDILGIQHPSDWE